MKVKCKLEAEGLTIGNIYDVIDIDNCYHIRISDDYGYPYWYHLKLFQTIEEIRADKLNKLGIN